MISKDCKGFQLICIAFNGFPIDFLRVQWNSNDFSGFQLIAILHGKMQHFLIFQEYQLLEYNFLIKINKR